MVITRNSYFLELLKKYLIDTCIIYSYCLLPNHFHLLIKTKEIDDIPEKYRNGISKIHQPFSNLFNAYTKAMNKKYNRAGSLFQKHLHRIKIDSEKYLRELILYIHLNPEKHKIIDDFNNYQYSSYNSYLSDKLSLLNRDEILNLFDNKENFKYCHQQRKLKLDLLKEIEGIDS